MDNDLLTQKPKTTSQEMKKLSYFQAFAKSWKEGFQTIDFSVKIILTLGILIIGATQFPSYLNHIQKRPGAALEDLVLNALPSIDVSVPIFTVLYSILIFSLIQSLKKAEVFLLYAITYVCVTIFRMVTITLVPLDAPVGLINLADPFAEAAVYGTASPVTKDLFFSGHTATMVLIWIIVEGRIAKILAGITCILIAFFLLLQHVHYTADVIAAFAFTVASYELAKLIKQWHWIPFSAVMLTLFALLLAVFRHAAIMYP